MFDHAQRGVCADFDQGAHLPRAVGGRRGTHEHEVNRRRDLHAGGNTLKLTIPAGGLTSGIVYDYLRLELAP